MEVNGTSFDSDFFHFSFRTDKQCLGQETVSHLFLIVQFQSLNKELAQPNLSRCSFNNIYQFLCLGQISKLHKCTGYAFLGSYSSSGLMGGDTSKSGHIFGELTL